MSIILDKVSHVYSPGNAYETTALSNVSLKIEDNALLISYEEDNKEKLKNSISKDVLEALFKEYIRNNKNEIINIIKDELQEQFENQISEAYDFAQEAMDFAQEAMDLAQEAIDKAEELENR